MAIAHFTGVETLDTAETPVLALGARALHNPARPSECSSTRLGTRSPCA
jgi:hypothetical protein